MAERHPHVERDLDLAEQLGLTLGQWDKLPESERAWWIDRYEVKQEECARHGGPRSDCANPETAFYPQMTVCYAEMEADAANWRWDQLHGGQFHDGTFKNWSDKRSEEFPYSHSAGVNIEVATQDLGLGGDFLSAPARHLPDGVDVAEGDPADD